MGKDITKFYKVWVTDDNNEKSVNKLTEVEEYMKESYSEEDIGFLLEEDLEDMAKEYAEENWAYCEYPQTMNISIREYIEDESGSSKPVGDVIIVEVEIEHQPVFYAHIKKNK